MPTEKVLKRVTPLRTTKHRFHRYCGGLTYWKVLVVTLSTIVAALVVGIVLFITNDDAREIFPLNTQGFFSAISDRVTKYHPYDKGLSNALLHFWKSEDVNSLIDLGTGLGLYAKDAMAADIFTSCYDGGPNALAATGGRCATVDLKQPIHFSRHDWVICLEAFYHIPQEFEGTLIATLDRLNKKGMIISWAVETGQGHVNSQGNNYQNSLIEKIEKLGYKMDKEAQTVLRSAAKKSYFKNAILVFRSKKNDGKGLLDFLFD